MRLRRLLPDGVTRLRAALATVRAGEADVLPGMLLESPELTEVVAPAVEVQQQTFARRYDAAEYLYRTFTASGLQAQADDVGLWAWLSVYFFDALCPRDQSGHRVRPGEDARWIPDPDYRRRYRHLLAGPFAVYAAHAEDPNRAMVVLAGPLDKPGEVVEQVQSRRELIGNPAALALATRLYVDSSTGRLKRGAAGSGAGSIRRLGRILNQYDLTFDIHGMDVEGMLRRLPKEFERFRS